MKIGDATITEKYRSLHPQSAQLYEEALRIFPSGVTHDIRIVSPFPVFVERASGSRKWDVDGNEYVDYVMGHGALFLGYAHPQITRAIQEQAAKGTHYGANHRLELEWGKLVKKLAPSAEKLRFTSSGTEATLMAVRLARAYSQRDKILKFDYNFHGWHDNLVGARFADSDVPRSAGVPESTLKTIISVPQGDLAAVEKALSAGDVAAVILEPTGASWGRLPLDPAFLPDLREVTRRYDTLLIFDEVVTGFRVSLGGAQGRYGVTPDLTTLAKILAGSLPGGCVTGRADILDMLEMREEADWNLHRRVAHPGTFNANPLSAAAGVTMLTLISEGDYYSRADLLTVRLIMGLNDILRRRKVPGCVYGLASYFHITAGVPVQTIEGTEWPAGQGLPPRMPPDLVMALRGALLNHGVDLMHGNEGFVSGVHTEADIDETIEAFDGAIQDLSAEGLV